MKKIVIIILLIIFVLLIALYLVGNYFFNIALNISKSTIFKPKTPEERVEAEQKDKNNKEWFQNNSNDIQILSEDGLKLHAYQLINKEETHIWALIIHGYMGQGSDMKYQTQKFYELGYNCLVVDLKSHGKSEGSYIGMGWTDRYDIIKWIKEICEKDSASEIILYGVSMGAATVMMTTGEELPENVKVAIEDCGYTSVLEEFKMQLKTLYNLPSFPVLNVASQISKIKAGYDLKEASSIKQVEKSKTPTLFIHGSEDTFVPFFMLDEVYEAAKCKKEKLVINGAKHAESSYVDPDTYWTTVERFINENL